MKKQSFYNVSKIMIILVLLFFCFNINVFASTRSLEDELINGDFTPKNSEKFNATMEDLTKTALAVMEENNISINHKINEQIQTIILGGVRVSAFSWGSRVGIIIKKIDETNTIVKVSCEARWGYAKNWTKDLLKGIANKLPQFKTNFKSQPNQNSIHNEDWLKDINTEITTTLSFDEKPILAINCERKYGDYLSGKIINYIGTRNSNILIVAISNQAANTAIVAAKNAGAKYILLCTPYFTEASQFIELQCKLVNIQTGQFLGGGKIIHLDKNELPNL